MTFTCLSFTSCGFCTKCSHIFTLLITSFFECLNLERIIQIILLVLYFIFSHLVCVFLSRCLNACTYCKTKHARGDLASYSIEELVERARQSFQGECIISPTHATAQTHTITTGI